MKCVTTTAIFYLPSCSENRNLMVYEFMPVFHDLGLIHIHNPRCGGTSLNRMLFDACGLRYGTLDINKPNYHFLYGNDSSLPAGKLELDHLTFSLVKDAVPSWIWEKYIIFCVVRHPLERFVSEFKRKKLQNCNRFPCSSKCSFEEFISAFLEKTDELDAYPHFHNHFYRCHFFKQRHFTQLTEDKNPPSYVNILRLENLREDWGKLIADYNLPSSLVKLPLLNRSSELEDVSEWKKDVSAELLRKVENYYADDYHIFNYSKLIY